MRIDQVAGVAIDHLVGRLLRRALILLVFAVCAIVALYQFTVAGNGELETQFGIVQAHLIVGAVYAAVASIALVIWWAMRSKTVSPNIPALNPQRELQIAMLIEAVMLGYSLARKSDR